MATDKYKAQFAKAVAHAFQKVYPEKYHEAGDDQVFSPDFILAHLEKPKDPRYSVSESSCRTNRPPFLKK